MFSSQFIRYCVRSLRSQNPRCQTTLTSKWNHNKFAELDTNYLFDENNTSQIEKNIAQRKGVGDIRLVIGLKTKLDDLNTKDLEYQSLKEQLYKHLLEIPNNTHPTVATYGDEPKVVKVIGSQKKYDTDEKEFHEITKRLNLVRTDQLGNVAGSKSYFIMGEMAELEHCLINYFIKQLLKQGYSLISVPDILHRNIIESCGMNTRGMRTQVYSLDPNLHGPDLCLSGTSEMALAGFFMHQVLSEEELPVKLIAVSRCYRAETSNIAEERGIYRVHEFTKVEMFVISTPEKSDEALEEIRLLEEENFESLGLHFKVLDMPPHELGAQAYRKYDIEAWLAGRKMYGEISSCSNCTDYQSRRLGIKYKTRSGDVKFVHTLNGTACAIPRLLIAITENFQNSNGTFTIPDVLQKHMKGKTSIGRQKKIPDLRLIKNKK